MPEVTQLTKQKTLEKLDSSSTLETPTKKKSLVKLKTLVKKSLVKVKDPTTAFMTEVSKQTSKRGMKQRKKREEGKNKKRKKKEEEGKSTSMSNTLRA